MMTSSEDGAVKWWDIRNMEAPVSRIDISGLDPDQQTSPCMMEYEPTIPSRFMIGSTLGTVLCCSRKAKDGKDVVLNRYKAHHGPVRSLQRNPLFPKNFLTAGDWSMKIWSEDITSSPLQWVWSGDNVLSG